MSWAGKQHPVELIIEWLAPVPLALAVGWSGLRLGFSTLMAAAASIAALGAGFAILRLCAGTGPVSFRTFEPAEVPSVEPDELILEEQDSILELDDRLDEVSSDSRVVRLFERQDPTPGELVDRIVDFLGEGRRPAPREPSTPQADASAALHDALANIRASLR